MKYLYSKENPSLIQTAQATKTVAYMLLHFELFPASKKEVFAIRKGNNHSYGCSDLHNLGYRSGKMSYIFQVLSIIIKDFSDSWF